MRVKIIRTSEDGAEHLENIRYTDEILEAGGFEDEAECERAETALASVGRYYLTADRVLFPA